VEQSLARLKNARSGKPRNSAGSRNGGEHAQIVHGPRNSFSVAQSLARLRGGLNGARWIDAEYYHITLRFIGDVDERVATTWPMRSTHSPPSVHGRA